jgi:NADPH-dependent 2,4-dienoyl-CoA reductase/sulfur reductase-like enzyme
VKEADLTIVGAGPGGLASAIEAARAGAKVVLLDENPAPGGQIYRRRHDSIEVLGSRSLGPDLKRGQKLLAEFDTVQSSVDYIENALVWGIFDDNTLAFARNGTSHLIRFRKLILSIGAYDRPVPFPGWTLPGVLSAGGAQVLVKGQRVLPGDKILLAGTGPLLLALAYQIIRAGGHVVAILEAGRMQGWLDLGLGLLGQEALLFDAMRYLWTIRKAGVPILRKHMILEARGNGRVEEAFVSEADENWRPKPGKERVFSVDTLCLGYGFIPSTELTRLAGCSHRYEPLLGGWIPERDSLMETSARGVYAVGDSAGIAGSLAAAEQGRIAGIAAARSLGYLSTLHAGRRIEPPRSHLNRLVRLRRALDRISLPRSGLYELATDDTVLCRCEEITLREIKEALMEGATEMSELKRMTRMGMGLCQGRMCGPTLQEIMARLTGLPPSSIGHLNPRPPVKPIPLSALQP